MPIPESDLAFVPPQKLSGYLLDDAHPTGAAKARWFLAFGYSAKDPYRLATDLLNIARTSSDFSVEKTPFGVKYIVRGQLNTPSGRCANVVTVWIKKAGFAPGLVTAVPGRRVK